MIRPILLLFSLLISLTTTLSHAGEIKKEYKNTYLTCEGKSISQFPGDNWEADIKTYHIVENVSDNISTFKIIDKKKHIYKYCTSNSYEIDCIDRDRPYGRSHFNLNRIDGSVWESYELIENEDLTDFMRRAGFIFKGKCKIINKFL